MIFETNKLTEILNQNIESMFYFKDFMPDHSIERVVPTGHVFILIELDGFIRNIFDNTSLNPIKEFHKVWVSGMHKNHISISAHQNSEMLVVQFKPSGAYPFFNQDMSTLNEQVVSGKEIYGSEIYDLRDAITKAELLSDKFKQVENWLLSKYQKRKVPAKELLSVIENLQENPVVNYNKAIEEYSKTQKHLINQFKKYVGLTPKYYQRILRFNQILAEIHQSKKIEWSDIAYQFEYTDQSHFIKEFKHFSGFNPQKFIQEQQHTLEPNFFPLD